LNRYILSYVGLALFTCSLLVTVSCFVTVRRLDVQMRQHQQAQLRLLAEDLDKRVQTMHGIALDIAITAEFKPYFFLRNPYYETFLVEALAKYDGRARLDSGYFLLYHSFDALYTKDAKNTPEIYFAHYFGTLEGQTLVEACRDAQGFAIVTGRPLPEGVQLWCLPVRLLAVQGSAGQTTLVFILQQSNFQDYVFEVIGETEGSLSVWYKDALVGSLGEDPPLAWSEDLFAARTAESGFTLWMRPGRFNSYESTVQLIRGNLFLFVAMLLLTMLLGIALAYRNYRPIRQTATRWGQQGRALGVRDELSSLQMAFAHYDQQQREDAQRLESQLHMLRRQMMALLLSGNAHDLDSEVAKALGVRMPHPCYCAVAVYADAGSDASEARVMEAAQRISGEGLCCYVAFSQEAGCVAVLLSLADPERRGPAASALCEACQELGLSVLMGVGQYCAAVNRLQISFLEAVSALNAVKDGSIRFYEDIDAREDLMITQHEAMGALLACLRSGDGEGAQARLDTLIERIVQETPSILLQCYLCTRVLNEIVQTANRLALPIPHEQVSWIYMSQSTKAYHEGISEVLWTLGDQVRASHADGLEALAEDLLRYIDAHCLDYALSLDMLSEHFSVSQSQISRLFRQRTGEAFKDYVVRQRVAQARDLIAREDLTIAELCMRVGYTNVSHFIKVFKAQIGLTPAAYKKRLAEMG